MHAVEVRYTLSLSHESQTHAMKRASTIDA